MSWVSDWVVVEIESNRVPSLLHLWVNGETAIVVTVNSFKNSVVEVVDVCLEGVVEHNLEVRVVIMVCFEAFWGASSVESDVAKGEGCCLIRLWSVEVKRDGGERSDVHPFLPVDSTQDRVDLLRCVVTHSVNEEFPSCSQLDCGNAGQRVLLDVEVEEVLEELRSDK